MKSVLDGLRITETAPAVTRIGYGVGDATLDIVGQCPNCGAPVYGRKKLEPGQAPVVNYACVCHSRVGTFATKGM